MGAVFVVDKNGKPLMPTYSKPKVRRMLKDGRAEIFRHEPFTIQLTQRAGGYTQPVHYDTDSGYQYAGVSVKSEKHEFLHMQADMLEDEKGRYDDRRKYRCTRRNRLRHRPPRFDNRRKGEGWIAPAAIAAIIAMRWSLCASTVPPCRRSTPSKKDFRCRKG